MYGHRVHILDALIIWLMLHLLVCCLCVLPCRRSVRLIHRCVLCNTDCHSLVAYFEHVKSRGHAVCVNQCSVSINRKEKKQNLKSKAAALEHKIASLLIHSNVSDMPAASLDHLQSRQQQSDLTMHGGHQHQPDGAVFGQTRSDNSSSAHACHADGHHSIRRSRRRPSSHRATGANTEPPAISRQPAMSSGAVSTSSGLDRTSSVSEFSNMSAVVSEPIELIVCYVFVRVVELCGCWCK